MRRAVRSSDGKDDSIPPEKRVVSVVFFFRFLDFFYLLILIDFSYKFSGYRSTSKNFEKYAIFEVSVKINIFLLKMKVFLHFLKIFFIVKCM